MKKIEIVNKYNKTFQAEFATQELADAWIAQETANQSWGKVERWLPSDGLQGNDIAESIANEIRGDVPLEGETDFRKLYYKFPDEFTVTQTDITAEFQIRTIKEKIVKAVIFGQQIVQDIAYLNITSGKTSAQISAMMTDSTNARIFALLSSGALATAKVEIQAIDETYFTTGEKSAIIASIDAFLASI